MAKFRFPRKIKKRLTNIRDQDGEYLFVDDVVRLVYNLPDTKYMFSYNGVVYKENGNTMLSCPKNIVTKMKIRSIHLISFYSKKNNKYRDQLKKRDSLKEIRKIFRSSVFRENKMEFKNKFEELDHLIASNTGSATVELNFSVNDLFNWATDNY